MSTRMIPIELFDIHEANVRPVDTLHVEELAALIEQNGFDEACPITAVKRGGRWAILSGKHRFYAARRVGISSLPVADRTDLGEEDAAFSVAVHNNARPFDIFDHARLYLLMKERYGTRQQEYARRVGTSQSAVSNGLSALSLTDDPEIGAYVKALSPSAISAIARAPEDDRLAIAKLAIEDGLSVTQINERVSRARDRRESADSIFESAKTKPEATREIVFVVPVSGLELLEAALRRAAELTESDDRAMHLLALCDTYLESYGVEG